MDIEQQPGGSTPDAAPADQQDKPRRTSRRRSASAPTGAPAATADATAAPVDAAPVDVAPAAGPGEDAAAGEAPASPAKRATRSRRKAAAPTEEAEDTTPETATADSSNATAAVADLPAAEDSTEPEAAPGEKPAQARSRRRTSARAAAVKAETSLPERQEPEPEETKPAAEPVRDEPAAARRAKSSVRARRRASTSAGPTAAEPAPTTQAEPQPQTGKAVAEEKPARAGRARTARGAASAAAATSDQRGADRETAPVTPTAGTTTAGTTTAEATIAEGTAIAAASANGAEPEDVSEKPQGARGVLFSEQLSPTSMIFQAPDLSTIVRPTPAVEPVDEEEQDENDDDTDVASRRRRRSRGRRSRTARGAEGAEGSEEQGEEDGEAHEEESEEVTSRRRRRRRRGDVDLELEGGLDDDPPGTVTRVRAPRTPSESTSTRVQSVKGSTRLEAKKQRRRESRESGRRRHVITEAEFLARRESVDRQMVVRQNEDRIQIAVLEDGLLAEHFVSKTQQDSLIGNVYLGRVQNVLPSMEAAFVDIGRGRNAVLYAGEVNWDAAGLDGAPRRIENALKSGDSVLVQVTKDPVGHKGARLTSQISLPGRYLVYVPGGSMTGISRKLPDVERTRLKKILKDRLPEDAGVIVRTAAEGASEEELTHDINRLRSQWESIQGQATSTKVLAPELLYGEPDLTIKVVRDVFNEDFSKLIVSGDEAWDTIEAYVTYVAPDLLGRLEKYQGDEDIFAQWRVDEQIHKALDRKVFLPSGGSLVIDRTEAMTVVDVNTGKFTGSGGNLEETVTKNNLEAAEEIVRQLRLRDIGGIIVIDFIDMVLESNRDLVLRRLVECLGRDRTKHQVAEVTSLGLVQMTRKRMGTGLLEVFSETCEVCAGRGVITYDEPVERGNGRPSAPAVEHQAPRVTEVNGAAAGRKRRRRGGGQPADAPATPAAAPEPPVDDAERQARAQATRAALAAVAAAAHAAHAHDADMHPEAHTEATEHAGAPSAPVQAPVPAAGTEAPQKSPTAAVAASAPAAQAEATHAADVVRVPAGDAEHLSVLTIGGERIELPHGDVVHEPPAPEPVLSLDALSQAFDQITGERHTTSEGEARPGRRRSRGARSGQGSAEVTRVEASEGAVGGQTRSASPAPRTEPQTPPEDGGPLILGVGVPASEL
ncbi:Rne/Rng family ribonuclease [Sinomonas sp. P10A9]|uniref:Ribonuclease E n=1 Tax=Sinomonas puerhi TaxID=3238584 RepID=A0AB39KYP7_9MICC